jgi:hypothetical protein
MEAARGVVGGRIGGTFPTTKCRSDEGRDLVTVGVHAWACKLHKFTQIDCNTPAQVHERLEMPIVLYGDTCAGTCWVTDHEFMSRSQGWDDGVTVTG